MTEQTPAGRSRGKTVLMGCGSVTLVAVGLALVGLYAWRQHADRVQSEALQAQGAKAEAEFAPALEKLSPSPGAYDIDRTVQVIHGLDLAMANQKDLPSYLQVLGRQDYRGVAPEVLESRKKLLEILQPLYAKQTELGDQQAMWEMTSEMLLATLSVVQVSGKVNVVSPTGDFSVDREQARKLWDDLKERQKAHATLQREVNALDAQLFDALVDYSDVYWKYVDEWDKLVTLRDRAYLAVHDGDWKAAEASAKLAIARAPEEREAHLLAAMAILEQGEVERFPEAEALLNDSIEQHPDQSAPALLLLGVLAARQGDDTAARLHLQQAAAYYPKQSDQLLEMLDPYKMRAFLEKSREGGFIVELYRSTMLGAGYFSPDLQLARLYFDEGDFEAGRAKVLDHFARRRAQQQWDFVISDIAFCEELLGPNFRSIFPEDRWLDLVVSKPMLGSGLALSVHNRGDTTLHNATLVLALHLTDMFPGQYTPVTAPLTVPAVVAHDDTDFGTIDPALQVAGVGKTVDDIVEHRAILISDEAVTWVDTDEFKTAEAQEFRKARQDAKSGLRPPTPSPSATDASMQQTYDRLVQSLSHQADLKIEEKFGKDTVLVTLPRELSILHPLFRLKYGDQLLVAQDNLIEGDRIALRFPSVGDLGAGATPTENLELVLTTPYGDAVLAWKPSGELSWDYRGVQPTE